MRGCWDCDAGDGMTSGDWTTIIIGFLSIALAGLLAALWTGYAAGRVLRGAARR
jgi:hypothetical protein